MQRRALQLEQSLIERPRDGLRVNGGSIRKALIIALIIAMALAGIGIPMVVGEMIFLPLPENVGGLIQGATASAEPELTGASTEVFAPLLFLSYMY